MTGKDRAAFGKLMAALAEAFSQEPGPAKLDVYFRALMDLEVEQIDAAVWNIIRTRTTATFPKVAEIREAVHGKAEDQAQLAWEKFIGAVREIGGHGTVIFDDPVIHAIVEREGGWVAVTEKSHEEMKWFAKDFIRIYQAYLPNQDNLAIPEKLIGIYEGDNAGRFDEYVPLPVYVGDKQKALAWQEKRRAIEGRTAKIMSLLPKLAGKGEEAL